MNPSPFRKSRSSQAIGERLRARRCSYGATLQEVSDAIHIRVHHLSYVERGQLEKIPESLYRRLFVKTYASYLGFAWNDIARDYEREERLYAPSVRTYGADAPIRRSHLWVTPRIIRNSFVGTLLCASIMYLAVLGWGVLRPPKLTIVTPTDNYSTVEESVIVSGSTDRDAHVTINGQPVAKDDTGGFREQIILVAGRNTIHISAAKKYSNEHSAMRTVYFEKNHVSIR